MKSVLLSALCCALTIQPAKADEVRLRDGRVYFGTVAERGAEIMITTRDGVVRVSKADVLGTRDAATLEKELSDLSARAAKGAFAHVELARVAREWGLTESMWAHADAALTAHEPAIDAALRAFLGECEPELRAGRARKTAVAERVQDLLWRVHREASPARILAITEVLAREPEADKALRRKAREATLEQQRIVALEALARRADQSNDPFVWRTALVDPARGLRERAALLARTGQRPATAVAYLSGGLESGDSEVRIRAAEAFAKIGDPSAIEPLVAAGPMAVVDVAGGGGQFTPRAHCAFVTQESFVQDFDVEVAQGAVIANPKINVLQYGSVLDVAVHAVQLYRIEVVVAYRKALRELAGSDPGADPTKWREWKDRLPATRPSAPQTPPPATRKTTSGS
jgi:hypothetical protein